MKVVTSLREWQDIRKNIRSGSVGFVPTLGGLHEGHASLLARARAENSLVVLSVFLNPTQFNDPNDLKKYPARLEDDLALAHKMDVDWVLAPTREDMYPDGYTYQVHEAEISQDLCGAHRPGHFDGVLTIVLKLLNLVRPDRAYFGEKDFQQLKLVQGMVSAFFLNCEIIPCPTVRDEAGLALSSRNRLLSAEQRRAAEIFARILKTSSSASEAKQALERERIAVDYVTEKWGRRLAAVRAGSVRLIDNVEV